MKNWPVVVFKNLTYRLSLSICAFNFIKMLHVFRTLKSFVSEGFYEKQFNAEICKIYHFENVTYASTRFVKAWMIKTFKYWNYWLLREWFQGLRKVILWKYFKQRNLKIYGCKRCTEPMHVEILRKCRICVGLFEIM